MRLGSYFTGGITPGTVRASKALIPDSNKDLGTLRTLTVTNLIADSVQAAALSGTQAQTAGTGTETFKVGGVIEANLTPAPSAGTTATQTLMTYSLPANTLDTTGRGLRIHAFGVFAGNAAPKTLQMNVGGQTHNTGQVTQSGSSWFFETLVFRTGSNAQRLLFKRNIGGAVVTPKDATDTSVDTGAITISVTMADASAATSNVIMDGLIVEYL